MPTRSKKAKKAPKTPEQPQKKPRRNRWKRVAVAFLTFAVVLAGLLVAVLVRDIVTAQEEKSDFPKIEISLYDTALETINAGTKDIKYEGNTVTLTVGGETREFENVTVKGRGNSTWSQVKKPYQIKLATKEDLFGLGKAKKWVLLANYFDRSYMRNDVAFKLAGMLGSQNAIPGGEYVELYVDGNYYGLYYMCHKANIGKDEVDLRDELGVLMELDNLHKDGEGYVSRDGNYLTVKDAVNEDRAEEAAAEFMADYNALERAARRGEWAAVQELIDARSFAEYYLISEFTVNPDAYTSSFFMYKDGPNDKIHAGPAWDFDLALGNRAWGWGRSEDFYEPTNLLTMRDYAYGGVAYDSDGKIVKYEADGNISRTIFYLLEMPEFHELVEQVWQEQMLGRRAELTNYIYETAAEIREAALRDEARWKRGEFDGEAAALADWVGQRYDFLNQTFGMKNDYSNPR